MALRSARAADPVRHSRFGREDAHQEADARACRLCGGDALGLFLPVVAVLGYLIIAVYIILPFGALRQRKAAA